MTTLRAALERLVGLVILAAAWEVTSSAGLLPEQFFPPLSKVAVALAGTFREGNLTGDMGLTLLRTAQGLAVALVLGIGLAVLTSTFATVGELVTPLVEFLRPIPSAAIIPIAIFFVGIGVGLFVFTVAFAALWPIYVVANTGLRSVDETLLRTGQSFGCGRWGLLTNVRLPSALPEIVTGTRIGGGMALLATILVEMLAGQRGLGYRLFETAFALRTAEMFGLVVLCGSLGIALNAILLRIGHLGTAWHTALSRCGEVTPGLAG